MSGFGAFYSCGQLSLGFIHSTLPLIAPMVFVTIDERVPFKLKDRKFEK